MTTLGEAPLDPDCEAFGRAPGIDGILGDYVGLPPEYTDKGPTPGAALSRARHEKAGEPCAISPRGAATAHWRGRGPHDTGTCQPDPAAHPLKRGRPRKVGTWPE